MTSLWKRGVISPRQSFFDSTERLIDTLGMWFGREVSRVGMHIRILSNLSPLLRRGDLENEITRIKSEYEQAIERLRIILSSANRKRNPERQGETEHTRTLKSIGTSFVSARDSSFQKRRVGETTSEEDKDAERSVDPLARDF